MRDDELEYIESEPAGQLPPLSAQHLSYYTHTYILYNYILHTYRHANILHTTYYILHTTYNIHTINTTLTHSRTASEFHIHTAGSTTLQIVQIVVLHCDLALTSPAL